MFSELVISELGLSKYLISLVAPDSVNVQNALEIGTKQCQQLSASLSADFHKTLKKQVKTMEVLKKSIEGETIYNLETLFTRLLVVGQKRGIEI